MVLGHNRLRARDLVVAGGRGVSPLIMGFAAAIALPASSGERLRLRAASVATVALIGAAGFWLGLPAVNFAAGVGAVGFVSVGERFGRGARRKLLLPMLLVVTSAPLVGCGLDRATGLQFTNPADLEAPYPPQTVVCRRVTTHPCAQEAARHAGFTVAWLESSRVAVPYGMSVLVPRGGRPALAVQNLVTRSGEVIEVYSRPPPHEGMKRFARTPEGVNVTIWQRRDEEDASMVVDQGRRRVRPFVHRRCDSRIGGPQVRSAVLQLIDAMRYEEPPL